MTPSLFVHTHNVTSVGVGFDPSGTKLGSGDMVGGVWVTEKNRVLPTHICVVSPSPNKRHHAHISLLSGVIHSHREWSIS